MLARSSIAFWVSSVGEIDVMYIAFISMPTAAKSSLIEALDAALRSLNIAGRSRNERPCAPVPSTFVSRETIIPRRKVSMSGVS